MYNVGSQPLALLKASFMAPNTVASFLFKVYHFLEYVLHLSFRTEDIYPTLAHVDITSLYPSMHPSVHAHSGKKKTS